MLKPFSFIAAFLVLVALLVAVEFFGSSKTPSIFAALDFDKAQTEAAAASPSKLLVVVFVGEACSACDEMDRKVWTNPELVEWLRARAIAVRIDRAKDPGHARALGVQSIPAAILIDGKQPLTKLEGPQTAREVIEKFNAALTARPKKAPEPTPEKPKETKPDSDPTTPPTKEGGASGPAPAPESPR